MSKHLKELMSDSDIYGWALVHTYHVVWLQQINNGRAKWTDSYAKLEFHHAFVWHMGLAAQKSAYANPPSK